jgi:2-phosphosulfolactate phosphatase
VPRLTIDCFHDALPSYPGDPVVVAVDVIRSTTTAISCVESGRRCIVVPDLEAAMEWRERLPEAILAGELGGNMPYGFDLTNSPVEIAALAQPLERPAILLSTSGTRLMRAAADRHPTLVAALRNWEAVAAELIASRPEEVVLIGAGTRGEFREEDELCTAWIGAELVDAGYAADTATIDIIERWRGAPAEVIRLGKSARYLRDSGQLEDLEFILDHVGDLGRTFQVRRAEVLASEAVPNGDTVLVAQTIGT